MGNLIGITNLTNILLVGYYQRNTNGMPKLIPTVFLIGLQCKSNPKNMFLEEIK